MGEKLEAGEQIQVSVPKAALLQTSEEATLEAESEMLTVQLQHDVEAGGKVSFQHGGRAVQVDVSEKLEAGEQIQVSVPKAALLQTSEEATLEAESEVLTVQLQHDVEA